MAFDADTEAGTAEVVPERPGTTEGAHSRDDLPKPLDEVRDFPCPRCGADLEYHIGHLALRCSHCDFQRKIDLDPEARVEEQSYQQALDRLREIKQRRIEQASQKPGQDGGREIVKCEGCSAEILFDESITATECAYCGTPIQRDRVHTDSDRIPVDGVLPFAVDKKQAQRNLSMWLKSLWFAPTEFVKRGLKGRFQGVYLPFYTFDSLTFSRYQGQRGDHYTKTVGSGKNKRTVTKTRWRRVSGKFQRFFDDVLTMASRSASDPLLVELEPWPLERLKPFMPEFLAGFQARTYDMPLEQGFDMAHQRMKTELERETRRHIGGDVQRISHLESRFDAVTYKHILLPMWLMSYSYRGKTFRIIINATTGSVHGGRPWSIVKIVLAVLAALLVLAVVLLIRALMG